MQVLLVTGGRNDKDFNLKSTEVLDLSDDTGTWELITPLPSSRYGLRSAVLDNNIFVFGENILLLYLWYLVFIINLKDIFNTGGYDGETNLKDILKFNISSQTWEMAGQMKFARIFHAVDVMEDVSKLCP